MSILIIFIISIITLMIIFGLRSYSLGTKYKNFLQVTQMNLILGKFPNLSQRDVFDFMTTSTCDSIRWILQQKYYQFFISKQYDVLVKLMNEAMILSAVYIVIEKWVNGLITREEAIDLLDINNPFIPSTSLNYIGNIRDETVKKNSMILPWKLGSTRLIIG